MICEDSISDQETENAGTCSTQWDNNNITSTDLTETNNLESGHTSQAGIQILNTEFPGMVRGTMA